MPRKKERSNFQIMVGDRGGKGLLPFSPVYSLNPALGKKIG